MGRRVPYAYFRGPEFDWLAQQINQVLNYQTPASGAGVVDRARSRVEQWTREERQAYASSGRPTLQINNIRDRLKKVLSKTSDGQNQALAPGNVLLTEQQFKDLSSPMVEESFRFAKAVDDSAKSLTVQQYNDLRGSNPHYAWTLPYVVQTYPMLLFLAGQRRMVATAEAHDQALREGWRETP